jgi:dihydrofolate reductase
MDRRTATVSERAMGKVIYSMNVSLDGFVDTRDHSLDWAQVDEELHRWFGDGVRQADALLYGRRLYELMAAYWPTAESDPAATDYMLDFARIWIPKPKVVFSTSLARVDWNSRLVRGDVGEQLALLRAEFDGDLDLGGPTLAAEFIRRGLVDEYRVVVHPVILGAGTPFFPTLDAPIRLRLVETRRFSSGATYLGYVPD